MIKQYLLDLKYIITFKKCFNDYSVLYSGLLFLGILIPYILIVLILKVFL